MTSPISPISPTPSDATLIFAKLEEEAQFYKAESWDTAQSVLRLQAHLADLEQGHRRRELEADTRLDLTARHAQHLRSRLDSSMAEIESLRFIVCQQQRLIQQQERAAEQQHRHATSCCSRSSSNCRFAELEAGTLGGCGESMNDSALRDSSSAVDASRSTTGSADSVEGRQNKWLSKIKNAL
ncbi:hypothetical protein HK101_004841, partial [Irineochytrium annulatum]